MHGPFMQQNLGKKQKNNNENCHSELIILVCTKIILYYAKFICEKYYAPVSVSTCLGGVADTWKFIIRFLLLLFYYIEWSWSKVY